MQVPICRHIKTNGLQCRGAQLKGSAFCYFHSRLHSTHDLYRNKVHFQSSQIMDRPFILQLPPVEDRESAQLAISCVINALATGCIDRKEANSLFYGLQLASANACGLRIVRKPTQLVRDIYKEPWVTIPEASPDIAPPGRTCEIDDPAEPIEAEFPLEEAVLPLKEAVIATKAVPPLEEAVILTLRETKGKDPCISPALPQDSTQPITIQAAASLQLTTYH